MEYGDAAVLLTEDAAKNEVIVDAAEADEAIAILKKLWDENRVYRMKVADILCNHFNDAGNTTQAEQWHSKLLLTMKARAAAYEKVWKSLVARKCDVGSLSDQITQYLSATFDSDACINSAWLFVSHQTLVSSRGPEGNTLAVHVLWLQIDTRIMQHSGCDEEEIAARYRRSLSRALPLCDAVLVETTLTTEPLPAELRDKPPLYSRVQENENHPHC